jgi:hypothetical protein
MASYIKSTDFSVKDDLITGDPDKRIKGVEIDDEFDAIAIAVATKADLFSPNFLGVPTAATASPGVNNTQLATTAFATTAATNAANASFPIGGIIMWSGSIATIPAKWQLCDGTNGTPDLRNRFIVGAGSTYAVNATGGSADAIVVSHTHTASSNTANLTGSFSNFEEPFGSASGIASLGANASRFYGGTFRNAPGSINLDASHSHTVTVNSEGSSGTNANLPPYFALAYIMRVTA